MITAGSLYLNKLFSDLFVQTRGEGWGRVCLFWGCAVWSAVQPDIQGPEAGHQQWRPLGPGQRSHQAPSGERGLIFGV